MSPHDEELARLVVAAQVGDKLAFAELARRFLRAAYAVALAIVVDPNDAQDLAQDAFVIALTRIDSCREPQRFAGWFLQIVRNHALNALAKRRVRAADAFDDATPSFSAPELAAELHCEQRHGRRALVRALSQLSEIQREVVLLHDLHDWTHGEIAVALGLSEGMSRQHLFKARRVLRQHLVSPTLEEYEHGPT